jgi:hypothetical protein
MPRIAAALLAFAIAAVPLTARADGEDRTARNTIYLEVLGNGFIYSLNYERFLTDNFNARIGAEYFSVNADGSGNANLLIVPATVSFLGLHKGAHGFELGAGIDFVYASSKTSNGDFSQGSTVAGTAIAGYRYSPLDGGFNLRFAFTPIFNSNGFLPWFGLAVGFGI